MCRELSEVGRDSALPLEFAVGVDAVAAAAVVAVKAVVVRGSWLRVVTALAAAAVRVVAVAACLATLAGVYSRQSRLLGWFHEVREPVVWWPLSLGEQVAMMTMMAVRGAATNPHPPHWWGEEHILLLLLLRLFRRPELRQSSTKGA